MKDTLAQDVSSDLKSLSAIEREHVMEGIIEFEKILDKIFGDDPTDSLLQIIEEIYSDESRDA